MQILSKLLSTDAYTPTNKFLAKEFGFVTSGYFGELIRQRDRFGQEEFYFSQINMQEEIGISEHEQRQALKTLVMHGFVTVKKKGLPAKYHFQINDMQVLDFLQHQSSKIGITCDKKFESQNKNENKNENKYTISKDIVLQNSKRKSPREGFEMIEANMDGISEQIANSGKQDFAFIKQELQKFYDYWTEADTRGKMRWQKEKTFEIARRFKRWIDNATHKSTLHSKPTGVGTL